MVSSITCHNPEFLTCLIDKIPKDMTRQVQRMYFVALTSFLAFSSEVLSGHILRRHLYRADRQYHQVRLDISAHCIYASTSLGDYSFLCCLACKNVDLHL